MGIVCVSVQARLDARVVAAPNRKVKKKKKEKKWLTSNESYPVEDYRLSHKVVRMESKRRDTKMVTNALCGKNRKYIKREQTDTDKLH